MRFIFDFGHQLFAETFDASRGRPFAGAVLAAFVVSARCFLIEDFSKAIIYCRRSSATPL
jgi:hypothetical protein